MEIGPFQMGIVDTLVTGFLTLMIGGLWAYLVKFVSEQREANHRNTESIRSMQRAEILRIFERVVEDGKPISVEEMDHLESCYAAYHANGGNGTGTLMYERIKDHALISTKVAAFKIGGSD